MVEYLGDLGRYERWTRVEDGNPESREDPRLARARGHTRLIARLTNSDRDDDGDEQDGMV